jgi:4a-hydroxytetrahydrobiopterin dehydratase
MPQPVPSGWTLTDNALTRTLERADFPEALALILEIAKLAEAANHHPDIDLRYRTVHLRLTTHSAGDHLTAKDYDLAQKINDLSEAAWRDTLEVLRQRLTA